MRRSGEQREVIRLARMRDAVRRDEQRSLPGQPIDVAWTGGFDDVAEGMILLDDDHDMVGPGHSRLGDHCGSEAGRRRPESCETTVSRLCNGRLEYLDMIDHVSGFPS